jgi:hypothetical protein
MSVHCHLDNNGPMNKLKRNLNHGLFYGWSLPKHMKTVRDGEEK